MTISSKYFGRIFISLIFAVLFCVSAVPVRCRSVSPEDFRGERLGYHVGFWLFSKSAEGSFSFRKNDKGYEAVFQAQTAGFLKLIVGKKTEYMKSIMVRDRETGMFRPLSFEETFTDGDKKVSKKIAYDYAARKYNISYFRNDRKARSLKRKMPDRPFADLLTFFYNLRAGAYGKVEDGMTLAVYALVNARPSIIRASVSEGPPQKMGSRYRFAFSVDRNISAAGSKQASLWFDKDLVPIYAVIEDAYFFGDLRIRRVE